MLNAGATTACAQYAGKQLAGRNYLSLSAMNSIPVAAFGSKIGNATPVSGES